VIPRAGVPYERGASFTFEVYQVVQNIYSVLKATPQTTIMDDSLRRVVHKCTTKIERHHRFAKHLAFGGGGHLRTNDPADQEKAIVYNELVANAVVLQNVVDQTNALHLLRSEGALIRHTDLTFLSPYATSNLKRFGDYPTDLMPEPVPVLRDLPA
jgi:Tn3 transposase DDE domain